MIFFEIAVPNISITDYLISYLLFSLKISINYPLFRKGLQRYTSFYYLKIF